jgi:hypothetical protein
MTIKHNYLIGANTKPTVAETTEHEIVINEADGTIYTKSIAGAIVRLGGADAPDLSSYETIVKSEADDVATLGSANAYTDAAIIAIPPTDLSLYETTIDSDAGDAATLVSANLYTDAAITAIPPVDLSTYETIVKSEADDATTLASAEGHADTGDAALQVQIDSLSGGISLRGNATVAELNAMGQVVSANYSWKLTDAGTLTEGAVAVVIGDNAIWDGVGLVWINLGQSDPGIEEAPIDGEGYVRKDAGWSLATDDIIATSDLSDVAATLPYAINDTLKWDGANFVNVPANSHDHSQYAPLIHTHVEADITDLDKYTVAEVDAALLLKAEAVHTHLEVDITDLDKYTVAEVDAIVTGAQFAGEPV